MPVAVDVLAQRVEQHGPVSAADADQGQFTLEVHVLFGDRRRLVELAPALCEAGRVFGHALAASVVTETPPLQDDRPAQRFRGTVEIACVIDGNEGRGRNAELAEEPLFGEAILGRGEHLGLRVDGNLPGHLFQDFDRHVLDVECQDIDLFRQRPKRIGIVERGHADRRDLAARGVPCGVQKVAVDAQSG